MMHPLFSAWADAPPAVLLLLFSLLGLLVGSFLNVVIYRLPKMMEMQWEAESLAYQNRNNPDFQAPEQPVFSLSQPASRCGHCGHAIAWYENIPVLSFLFLRAQCSACHTPISLRYPLIELLTAAAFAGIALRFGASMTTVIYAAAAAALIALILIDWDTTLLPDDLTLPSLWGGLVAAALNWNPLVSGLSASLWGAVLGYLVLWSVYWAFKLVTGKEGMGYGDFKLLAALGAWLGPLAIIPILIISSLIGLVVGGFLKLKAQLREGNQYLPFGPFLGLAAVMVFCLGSESIMQRILGLLRMGGAQ